MEQYERVRRDRRLDPEVSIRELARRHGVHRRDVRAALVSAIQSCQLGELRWVEMPAAGQDPHQLESPAAVLRLTTGPPPLAAPRQTGAGQPGPSQAGAHDQRAAGGTRPEGGVRAGAGGTAGPTLAGLLIVVGGGLLGAGVLFVRLRQDA